MSLKVWLIHIIGGAPSTGQGRGEDGEREGNACSPNERTIATHASAFARARSRRGATLSLAAPLVALRGRAWPRVVKARACSKSF